MKNIKLMFALAIAGATLASCADEFDTNDFAVQRPGNTEQYEYLKDYAPLRTYLDRQAHPDFKVGAALTASDFNTKGNLYTLARANFDEVVAGNAMKMSSCIDDKGNTNFGTVSSFVQAAEDGGLNVYGHTLVWHSQQPVKWLNKLIADKPKPKDPNAGEPVEKDVNSFSYLEAFGSDAAFPFYAMGSEPPIVGGKLHYVADGEWRQFFCRPACELAAGDYGVYFKLTSDAAATIDLTVQNGWGSDAQSVTVQLAVKAGEQDAFVKVPGLVGGSYDFILKPGVAMCSLDIESIRVVTFEVVADSDVEYKDVWTPEELKFVARDKTHADTDAEVIAGAGPNGEDVVVVRGKTETTNSWSTQFFINTPGKKWEAGEKYRLHMWYKASKAIDTDSQVHGAPGAYIHWAMLSPNPSFTTEWQEKTWESTIPSQGGGNQQTIAFNMNKNRTASEDTKETVDQIDYYFAGITWESCTQVEVPKTEEVTVNKRCIIIESADKIKDPWETQFWIQTNEPYHGGDTWEFEAELRADIECAPGTQCHKGSAGSYVHWAAIGNPKFTTEWETVKMTGTIPNEGDGCDFIAWNMNDCADANKFYIGKISFKINGVEMLKNGDLKGDDISSFWKKEKSGATINAPISNGYSYITEVKSTIPLTEEEIKDTLTYAMTKWIDGVFKATEGKVKAWDLVNEAVSGGGDVEGNYDLQHKSADNTTDFFWQDYLGNVEYVVLAEKLARAAYAKQEFAQGDLKLFVNDYNLESDWDQNKKLKSLIYWIGKWEKAGATIDGIGTQMHISYYEDEKTQESKKAAITNMFDLMSKTGKLVRVSELDMGLVDAEGNTVVRADMTFEREKKMAEFYQWIVEEYFRVVPAAQQYGICQWCITDANEKSGWRPDEPVGLWYTDYTRKPAYAGWAEGLKAATK